MLDELCVSKTGTLTKGELKATKIHFKNENIAHEGMIDEFEEMKNTLNNKRNHHTIDFSRFNDKLSMNYQDIIKECIVASSDVRIEICDETRRYIPCGNPVEVGMV